MNKKTMPDYANATNITSTISALAVDGTYTIIGDEHIIIVLRQNNINAAGMYKLEIGSVRVLDYLDYSTITTPKETATIPVKSGDVITVASKQGVNITSAWFIPCV